jgi:acylphosphatase
LAKMRIIAEGVLQGVGYRAIVKQAARFLGIQGLVRNLEDGRVEIFCQGSKNRIKKFLEIINIKGKHGDIMNIDVTKIELFKEREKGYSQAWKPYKGFEIDYGIEKLSPLNESTLEDHEFGKLYFSTFRNELKTFREETSLNFAQMAQKYGDISTELKEFRKGIERFLTKFLKEYTKKT